jgi:hypothetical protein
MKFSEWFVELKTLAFEAGLSELIGNYIYHVDSYTLRVKPEQELERLITIEREAEKGRASMRE